MKAPKFMGEGLTATIHTLLKSHSTRHCPWLRKHFLSLKGAKASIPKLCQ